MHKFVLEDQKHSINLCWKTKNVTSTTSFELNVYENKSSKCTMQVHGKLPTFARELFQQLPNSLKCFCFRIIVMLRFAHFKFTWATLSPIVHMLCVL